MTDTSWFYSSRQIHAELLIIMLIISQNLPCSAIVILIFIIKIQQDLFDNSHITNNSHIVAILRTEARSYLEKAATETITTSDRGGGMTKNMVKGVEELREKMVDMLKENGNLLVHFRHKYMSKDKFLNSKNNF